MVHVLYDDEIFSIQIQGGISRYFTELYEGLTSIPDIKPVLPFSLTCNRHVAAAPHFAGRLFFGGRAIPGRRTLVRRINRRSVTSELARGRCEVVHATFYDDSLLDRLGKARLVVTVHDMAPEIIPEMVAGLGPDFCRAKRLLIAKADAVVAVSATTAADVTRLTGRPRQDIRVIHLGISDRFRWRPETGEAPNLPERFVLYVGQRGAYKNFLGVAPALSEVMRNDGSLALVCFGGGPLTADERAPFEQAGVARRVVSVGGDDRALAAAYARASAFIFPSLYEGFGLPILEAMINRCPTILARRSCFPEVAADAALYFDPGRPAELVEALNALLRDPALRRQLGEAGARRATDFSWRRCVAEHAELYRELAA
jgi:glycosyltransferase involved in cell wall biosynthesis